MYIYIYRYTTIYIYIYTYTHHLHTSGQATHLSYFCPLERSPWKTTAAGLEAAHFPRMGQKARWKSRCATENGWFNQQRCINMEIPLEHSSFFWDRTELQPSNIYIYVLYYIYLIYYIYIVDTCWYRLVADPISWNVTSARRGHRSLNCRTLGGMNMHISAISMFTEGTRVLIYNHIYICIYNDIQYIYIYVKMWTW